MTHEEGNCVPDQLHLVEPASMTAETSSRVAEAGAWLRQYPWALALAGYLAITLTITHPLVFHLGDTTIWPYKADDNLWYAWYPFQFRTALAAGQDPTYTHLMYALVPRIQLFADSYYSGVIGAALLTLMTPLAVYNVLVLLTFVLSGFTMYLLVNEFVPNRWACFIAGFLYTFSTFHFWHATGQLTLATMQWLPLAAWRAFAFYRRPNWRNAIWMGLALALLPLSDPYQAAYFTLPFGLLFVGGLLIANRRWLGERRNLVLAALGLAIAAAAALPLMATSLHVDDEMRAAVAQESAL
jgi:hypothetical protein